MVADSAETSAGGFALGSGDSFGGEDEGTEDDGGFFLCQPGFDDEAAELDFIAGILFARVHGDAADLTFKPDQQVTEPPVSVLFGCLEIGRRWSGTPGEGFRRRG